MPLKQLPIEYNQLILFVSLVVPAKRLYLTPFLITCPLSTALATWGHIASIESSKVMHICTMSTAKIAMTMEAFTIRLYPTTTILRNFPSPKKRTITSYLLAD